MKLIPFNLERPFPPSSCAICVVDNGNLVVERDICGNAGVDPAIIFNGEDKPAFLAHPWYENYFHWIVDCISDVHYYRNILGFDPVLCLPVPLDQMPNYAQSTLAELGNKLVVGENKDYRLRMDWVFCRHNIVLQEGRTMGFSHWYSSYVWNKWACEKYGNQEKTGVIILQRNKHGDAPTQSRNLSNREELMSELDKLGIKSRIVCTEGMSFEDQALTFMRATAVIGVHGAGLTNIVFCKRDCPVIEIISPLFYQHSYIDIGSNMGMKYCAIKSELGVPMQQRDLYRHCVKVDAKAVANKLSEMLS